MATAPTHPSATTPDKPPKPDKEPTIQEVVDYILESGVNISDLSAELARTLVAEDAMKQVIETDLKSTELAKDEEEFNKKVDEEVKKWREAMKKKREAEAKEAALAAETAARDKEAKEAKK